MSNFNPISPSQYIGKQIIGNTDRILLNSKEDTLLFSNKGFSFSTNGEFHFNTENRDGNRFVVNAPKIQLGIDNGGTTTNNPAVKGNELVAKLGQILDVIEQLYNVDIYLYNPIAPLTGPVAPDATWEGKTGATLARIKSLRKSLDEIKSEKVFLI